MNIDTKFSTKLPTLIKQEIKKNMNNWYSTYKIDFIFLM